MERKISLNGEWSLYFSDEVNSPVLSIENYCEGQKISAAVPGNAELDLSRAGLLPDDLYKGMATVESEKCEVYGYWYEKTFAAPCFERNERVFLRFGAVDCVARYYLNGELVFESENAFIPQEFEITSLLKEKNTLTVHILSSTKEQLTREYETDLIMCHSVNHSLTLRKPVHSAGWDIMPRAVTAGLWRDVDIVIKNEYSLENVYYKASADRDGNASLLFYISINAPAAALMGGNSLKIRVSGTCGEDSFISGESILNKRKYASVYCEIQNPKIWWPYGYGEPNIYDTKVQLLYGDTVVEEKSLNVGLRSIKLDRTESLKTENPRFRFIVNGEVIFCRGSNWVPMDAYHSKDKARYQKALELATDIGCNMLRVWGGGVYEDEYFYDYCDRHGMLVWQDFMMACQRVPTDEKSLRNLEAEFTAVVKQLRNHPSLALWCGDNEIDELNLAKGLNTDNNVVTRRLLPDITYKHDPFRSYLPSSPFVKGELTDAYAAGEDIFPERHLWGARDYFKADFYRNSKACFVSETGYHGCPNIESLPKIVDEECVWPCFNEQWTLHSSDQRGSNHRVRLMDDQICQLFGKRAETLEDFVFASQISQAEAKKFFIERMRIKRPYTGGILWWNLLDGWPQMSDAVVDYFYSKKIAYYYIKRSQAPFALMIDELKDWHYTLVAANDTFSEIKGGYEVSDIETGEVLCGGTFTAKENTATRLNRIRLFYSEQRMLLIKWVIDGKVYYNHYLAGMPPFNLEKYAAWYGKLKELTGEEN